jgi:hypothetical protein
VWSVNIAIPGIAPTSLSSGKNLCDYSITGASWQGSKITSSLPVSFDMTLERSLLKLAAVAKKPNVFG